MARSTVAPRSWQVAISEARSRSRKPGRDLGDLLDPELLFVELRVGALGAHDLADVGARLGERDVAQRKLPALRLGLLRPLIDVGQSGVVGGDRRELGAAVVTEQVAEVVAAVGDVDFGVGEVADREGRAVGDPGEVFRRRGEDLQETLSAGRRFTWLELRLGI